MTDSGEGKHWIDHAWKELVKGDPDGAISFFMPNLAAERDISKEPTCITPKHPAIGGKSDKGSTESDVCLELPLRTGTPSRAVFIVEQQHEKKDDLAERIFKSWYRASDEHKVPVTCLAIYTGTTKPVNTYTKEWQGTSVSFMYNTCSVANMNAEELKRDGRDFAIPVLAAKRMLEAGEDASKRGEYSLELLQEMNKRDIDKNKKILFHEFTSRILRIDKDDISREVKEEWKMQRITVTEARKEIFEGYARDYGRREGIEQGITKGIEQGITKGIEQGITKGIEQGITQTAQNLLKMGLLTAEQVAQGTGLSLKEVADIQKNLQDANLTENTAANTAVRNPKEVRAFAKNLMLDLGAPNPLPVTNAQPGKKYSGEIIGVTDDGRNAIMRLSENQAVVHDLAPGQTRPKVGERVAMTADANGLSTAISRDNEQEQRQGPKR